VHALNTKVQALNSLGQVLGIKGQSFFNLGQSFFLLGQYFGESFFTKTKKFNHFRRQNFTIYILHFSLMNSYLLLKNEKCRM